MSSNRTSQISRCLWAVVTWSIVCLPSTAFDDAYKSIPNISGNWTGQLHDNAIILDSKLEITQKGANVEGCLTNTGLKGTSKHYVQGSFDCGRGQFILRDIGLDKVSGDFPVSIDRYEIHTASYGEKLIGSCQQQGSRKQLSLSLQKYGIGPLSHNLQRDSMEQIQRVVPHERKTTNEDERLPYCTSDPKLDEKTVRLNNEGVEAINVGNCELAIQRLQQAIQQNPTYEKARKNLAIAYNNYGLSFQSNHAKAIEQFERALSYDPNNTIAQNNLANYRKYSAARVESMTKSDKNTSSCLPETGQADQELIRCNDHESQSDELSTDRKNALDRASGNKTWRQKCILFSKGNKELGASTRSTKLLEEQIAATRWFTSAPQCMPADLTGKNAVAKEHGYSIHEKMSKDSSNTVTSFTQSQPDKFSLGISFDDKAGAVDSYVSYLSKAVKPYWRPPGNCPDRKLTVFFRINKEGQISDLRIDDGQPKTLDGFAKSAFDAIKDAAPFNPPPIASGLMDIHFDFHQDAENRIPTYTSSLDKPTY